MKPENALNPLECLIQNLPCCVHAPHLFTEIFANGTPSKSNLKMGHYQPIYILKMRTIFQTVLCVCVCVFIYFCICILYVHIIKMYSKTCCIVSRMFKARFLEGTQPFRYENPLKSPAWHFSGMACPSNCPARLSWHSMLHGATPPDFRNEGRQLSETFGSNEEKPRGGNSQNPRKFNSEFDSWKPWWLEY